MGKSITFFLSAALIVFQIIFAPTKTKIFIFEHFMFLFKNSWSEFYV